MNFTFTLNSSFIKGSFILPCLLNYCGNALSTPLRPMMWTLLEFAAFADSLLILQKRSPAAIWWADVKSYCSAANQSRSIDDPHIAITDIRARCNSCFPTFSCPFRNPAMSNGRWLKSTYFPEGGRGLASNTLVPRISFKSFIVKIVTS